MVTYSIANQYFMVGAESTWGNYVEPTKDVGLVQSANVNENNNPIYSYGFASANAAAFAPGKYDAKFSAELRVQHGRLLELALARGATVSNAGGSDPYTHTFTPSATGVLTPFTAEFGLDSTSDIIERLYGAILDNLRMSLDLDGVLTFAIDGIAKAALKVASVATSTQSTLPTFPSSYATFKFGVENSEAAQALMQNMEFSHANNLLVSHGFSSRLAAAQAPGRAEETISFTAVLETTTALERFWGAASGPNATIAEGGLVVELKDAASSTREITIDFDNVTFGEHNKSYSLDGVAMQDVTARARSIEQVQCKDSIADWF